jgi:hypothetical protein
MYYSVLGIPNTLKLISERIRTFAVAMLPSGDGGQIRVGDQVTLVD